MQNQLANSKASQALVPFNQQLSPIKEGQNILLCVGGVYSLMKYEYHKTETEGYHRHRYNRHGFINTALGDLLLPKTSEERRKADERRRREWKRHKGNIYGTHRLDFSLDEEFNLFLPSSTSRDIFLTLARETSSGEIVPRDDVVEIISGDNLITDKLQEITRPAYFEKVVLPLLEGRCTEFQAPRWSKRLFRKVNKWTLLERFERETRDLEHGAFVYVGCKEEVYLLGIARHSNGEPYMQGTYSTSTKPIFYFSNNYLEFISRRDVKKPMFKGNGSCNVAVYRTYDIPGFEGGPFIFPQMGRKQDCKNTLFTGEPELITGNVDEALGHFASTDFAEFADVVRRYAEQIDVLHPSTGKPNGRFYY